MNEFCTSECHAGRGWLSDRGFPRILEKAAAFCSCASMLASCWNVHGAVWCNGAAPPTGIPLLGEPFRGLGAGKDRDSGGRFLRFTLHLFSERVRAKAPQGRSLHWEYSFGLGCQGKSLGVNQTHLAHFSWEEVQNRCTPDSNYGPDLGRSGLWVRTCPRRAAIVCTGPTGRQRSKASPDLVDFPAVLFGHRLRVAGHLRHSHHFRIPPWASHHVPQGHAHGGDRQQDFLLLKKEGCKHTDMQSQPT